MQQEERIEDLHQRAAGQYLQGEFSEALDLWKELLRVDPLDERALEGVRLCELLSGQEELGAASPDSLALPITGAEDCDHTAVSIDLGEPLDLHSTPAAGPRSAGASGPEAAALELSRRVEELLREATTAWEAGDRETATNLIGRVFILDEHNQAATRLQEAMQAEIDASAAQPRHREADPARSAPQPPSEFELPIDVENSLLDALPDSGAAMPAEDVAHTPAQPVATGPARNAAAAADDEDELPRVESPAPKAVPRPGLRRTLALSGLAVAAVAGGWLAWHFVGPTPSASAPEPAPPAASRQAKPRAPKQAEAAPPQQPVAAPAPGESAATQIDTARAALDSGANADAIIACNRALELEPGNPEATALLARAAEAYKAQHEHEARIQGARDLFGAGDYAGALKIFYRLPEAQGDARFDRYKANGWYNLALRAMAVGNCADARSSVTEAASLAPRDAQVVELQRLARVCTAAPSDVAFHETIAAKPFRNLDD